MHDSTLISIAISSVIVAVLLLALQNQRRKARTIRRKFIDMEGEEQRMFTFLHDLGLAIENEPSASVLSRIIVDGIDKVVTARGGAIYFVGADQGVIADPATPGPIPFDRGIPLDKVLKSDCLLAHQFNGEALPPSHGFPLRAVIGGWYGMASVKWLSRIIVTDKPYQGFWQTLDYSYFERRDGGLAHLVPVTSIDPKAVIAKPSAGEVVAAGKAYRVHGAAWAGERKVGKVEFSADGAKTWNETKVQEQTDALAWTFWDYAWTPAAPGPAALLVRCTDDRGNRQPATRDPDRRTYKISHTVPVDVLVK